MVSVSEDLRLTFGIARGVGVGGRDPGGDGGDPVAGGSGLRAAGCRPRRRRARARSSRAPRPAAERELRLGEVELHQRVVGQRRGRRREVGERLLGVAAPVQDPAVGVLEMRHVRAAQPPGDGEGALEARRVAARWLVIRLARLLASTGERAVAGVERLVDARSPPRCRPGSRSSPAWANSSAGSVAGGAASPASSAAAAASASRPGRRGARRAPGAAGAGRGRRRSPRGSRPRRPPRSPRSACEPGLHQPAAARWPGSAGQHAVEVGAAAAARSPAAT